MTKAEMSQLIIETIERLQGCKGTELAFEIGRQTEGERFSWGNVPDLLDELVEQKKIREVEYVLPSLNYRCKSYYLPANTEIRVRD